MASYTPHAHWRTPITCYHYVHMNNPRNRFTAVVISALCIIAPSFAFASFDTNLNYGASGSAVLSLQQFLVAQNYQGSGSWMETGYFGKATVTAVQQFQNQQGITPASGFFGPATRARANQMSSNDNSVSTVTNTNSNDNSIAATIASLRAQIQQLEFQIAALSGGNTNNGNTTTQCTSAPIPTTVCSGTWSAATVSNGCTLSWQCVVNTPTTPTTSGTYSIVSVTPSSGNPNTVNVVVTASSCAPSTISWGDGSTPVGKAEFGSGGCNFLPSNNSNTTFTHTYTNPGTYTISILDGAGNVQGTYNYTDSSSSSSNVPSDFNFDFQYGWGDELNTFNGTYSKFEGVGVPVATAAFSLTSSQRATIYSNIQTVLSDPTISAPKNNGTMRMPCDSETLKVQANGKIQTYTWNCSMNAEITPSFNTGLIGWVINTVQGVDAALPAPSGGLIQ